MSVDIEPPALPDGFVCPEGTVPGWINADGLPTSCVGDLPLVEPLPDRVPGDGGELLPPIGEVFPPALPLDPLPDVLAATGAGDLWSWVLVAVLLLAVGGWALWAGRAVEGES